MKSKIFVFTALLVFFCTAFVVSDGNAQTRRTRTKKTKTVATPTPSIQSGEATIISLANQNNDQNQVVTNNNQTTQTENTTQNTTQQKPSMTDLNERITQLEANQKETKDEKQKRLLMNLDILSKAEQRAEALRKQFFEMIEKQNTIQARLEQINFDLRPEAIERYGATIGSLRPESVREARQKTLESEKRNLESLLSQITTTRAMLEQNVQRADVMVERLREKLEKEIDAAIEDK